LRLKIWNSFFEYAKQCFRRRWAFCLHNICPTNFSFWVYNFFFLSLLFRVTLNFGFLKRIDIISLLFLLHIFTIVVWFIKHKFKVHNYYYYTAVGWRVISCTECGNSSTGHGQEKSHWQRDQSDALTSESIETQRNYTECHLNWCTFRRSKNCKIIHIINICVFTKGKRVKENKTS